MKNSSNDQMSDGRGEQEQKVLAAFWALQPRRRDLSAPLGASETPRLAGAPDHLSATS